MKAYLKLLGAVLRRSSRGQGLVEFAFGSVLFFMAVFGIFGYGLMVWQHNFVANLAQEGVRRASVCGSTTVLGSGNCTTTAIKNFVQSRALGTPLCASGTSTATNCLIVTVGVPGSGGSSGGASGGEGSDDGDGSSDDDSAGGSGSDDGDASSDDESGVGGGGSSSSTSSGGGCTSTNPSIVSAGSVVCVHVKKNFRPFTKFVPNGLFGLQSTAKMIVSR